jgi:hypothetical protein
MAVGSVPAVPTTLTRRFALALSTGLVACCYKTHVRGKHKAALLLFLFLLATLSIATSCSSQVAREDDPDEETVQVAHDADEEEVVESDDGFSDYEEGGESGSQKTAGFLMAIGYLAMTVGSALLPLLMM